MARKIEKQKGLENIIITAKEALALLDTHKGGRKLGVHSYTDGGIALMGCSIDLSQIKIYFKKCEADEIVLSGKNMRSMGHGVAFWRDEIGWTFLETDREKIEVINKEKEK